MLQKSNQVNWAATVCEAPLREKSHIQKNIQSACWRPHTFTSSIIDSIHSMRSSSPVCLASTLPCVDGLTMLLAFLGSSLTDPIFGSSLAAQGFRANNASVKYITWETNTPPLLDINRKKVKISGSSSVLASEESLDSTTITWQRNF